MRKILFSGTSKIGYLITLLASGTLPASRVTKLARQQRPFGKIVGNIKNTNDIKYKNGTLNSVNSSNVIDLLMSCLTRYMICEKPWPKAKDLTNHILSPWPLNPFCLIS